MADICPEGSDNRTDCLLAALLDATTDTGYNWNPITFAFTAAIGFLALVVAIITVFQGLLSAGPGRVKASRHAIGNFAEVSRSRFNLFEMAIRTKSMVPFFSWGNFVTDLAQLVERKETLQLKRDKEGIKDHSATWLSIMGRLKLDNPKFWEKNLIPRATDYLPSDIYAAPAAAEARCLALLVVLADDHCEIVVNDRYIEVRGATSQLSFREHPVAGKVAAFDDFCISTTRSGQKPSGVTPTYADVRPLLVGCELIDGKIRSKDDDIVNLLRPHRDALAMMWRPFGEDDGCDHSWCCETAEAWWSAKQGNQFNTEDAPWRRIHNPHGGCISEDILTSVNQWMVDVGDAREVDAVDIVMREYMLHQLQDVCTWMEDQPGVPWKCATRAILYRIWHREHDDLQCMAQDVLSPMSASNAEIANIAPPNATTREDNQTPRDRMNSIASLTTTANGILTKQIASVTSLNQLVNEPIRVPPRRAQTEPIPAHAPAIITSDSIAMDGIQAIVAYRALLYGIFFLLNTDTSVFADLAGAGHVEAIVKVL